MRAILLVVYAGAPAIAVVVVAALNHILLTAAQRSDGNVRAERRTAFIVVGVLAAWFGLAAALAINGAFRPTPGRPALIGLFIVLPLIGGLIALVRNKGLRRLLDDPASQRALIVLQTYRVGGASFLVMFLLGQLPAIMAMPAGVGDVLTGAFAYSAFAALRDGRRGRAIAWNVFGIVDLLVAVTLAVITGPGPTHLITTQPSTLALLTTPQVLVPAFIVPLALLMHVASLRGLLSRRTVLTAGPTTAMAASGG
ncbi:MAG TPA: MFS transporter [Candidatus Dormibacteraeota bacterium]|jgi:hypothetical protein